jgi:16S rRNA G1207 methylase RsmC
VQGVEVSHTLSEILKSKGHTVHFGDFLNWFPLTSRYDRVLMNPPFEKGQDMEHIQHAFEMLEDLGRLVSVISPGPFFHSSKKAEAFRQWFEDLGGEVIDLPEGSFKDSGTGVASKLVVIDK